MTGIGGSFVAHALIIALAIIGPFSPTKTILANPFWTVNLVTMQDLGLGKEVPAKGTTVKGGAGPKGQDDQRASASRTKAGPLVPVKRLQMDEPTTRSEAEIKKLEAPEVPKFSTNPQSASAVEKSVEKLIPKPKTPERVQVAQGAREPGEKGAPAAASTEKKEGQGGAAGGGQAGEKGVTGTRDGSAKGVGEKAAQQGGPPGGADGAQVGLARRLYYTEIWNAIRRQWALPEFLKSQRLETVLVVVVRRDGKVLDLRVEKSSGNEVYDESARRAVRKAEPLPPFPAIYSPPQEEIGLRFRPEDLS